MLTNLQLEIGLLTSLPLLKEIVADLEEMQASDDAKSFIYFTKESHIYTLLNCILEGGIETKIARSAIPELDYLSQISFELYESETTPSPPPKVVDVGKPMLKTVDSGLELSTTPTAENGEGESTSTLEPTKPVEQTFAYSIRITISPGAHTYDPLDVQLDSKHCIGCAPRRSLTQHMDWREVIERLRDKFGTVKLPKRFLAINLSESHSFSRRDSENGPEEIKAAVEDKKSEYDATNESAGGPEKKTVAEVARDLEKEQGFNFKDRAASVSSLLVGSNGEGIGSNKVALEELQMEAEGKTAGEMQQTKEAIAEE